jgi:hypothetical protein
VARCVNWHKSDLSSCSDMSVVGGETEIRVTGGRRRIDRSSCVNGDEITVDGGYASMLMNLVPQPGFE